jgi:RNA polymerase sigma-70 factor (ECF subfamily)
MLRRLRSLRAPKGSDAFAADVLGLLKPLYVTALRLARSRPDAEDLVQDTVLKALRSSNRFEPGTNLKAWLFTILHNTWRNRRRDAARDTVEVDSERVEQAAADGPDGLPVDTPETLLLRSTLDADLQAALDELPEAFREAVWLRDVDEFPYAEIARMLDIPIGTVMSRISRGRRLLFERLTRSREAASGFRDSGLEGRDPKGERHTVVGAALSRSHQSRTP